MTTVWKAGLILLGYIAAFVIASAALALRLLTESGPETSGGMYAAGDTMLFLAAFTIAALPPTGVALYFLRANRTVWRTLAVVGFAIAMTGLAAIAASIAGGNGMWAGLSPLRILAAPVLMLAFFMSGLIAPNRFPRITFFVAACCEAAVSVWAGLLWFNQLAR